MRRLVLVMSECSMARSSLQRNGEADRSSEKERLVQRVRRLERERRSLVKERDAYRDALLARWKKESREEDWSDFDPGDYTFTLADILAEFEREEGPCLPRRPIITSSTPGKSKKSSKTSSAKRKKPAS